MKLSFGECDCGSSNQKQPMLDGHGIFLTFVCSECRDRKIAQFRSDIFTRYDTDEAIDE